MANLTVIFLKKHNQTLGVNIWITYSLQVGLNLLPVV